MYLCPLHGMEKVVVGRGDSVTTPGLHQAVRKESPLIKGKEKLSDRLWEGPGLADDTRGTKGRAAIL